MAGSSVQLPTPPDAPWVAHSSPHHSLHPIPLPVFEALAAGDLGLACSLAPPTLPPLTKFFITPSNRVRWRRRLDLIGADVQNAPWMLRLVVLDPDLGPGREDQQTPAGSAMIVGRIGFHGKPDERGMVEVGYEIDPEHQGRGHTTAAMRIIVHVAQEMEGVNVLRASVSDGNLISTRIAKGQGLRPVGSQVLEKRGLAIIYELNVQS